MRAEKARLPRLRAPPGKPRIVLESQQEVTRRWSPLPIPLTRPKSSDCRRQRTLDPELWQRRPLPLVTAANLNHLSRQETCGEKPLLACASLTPSVFSEHFLDRVKHTTEKRITRLEEFLIPLSWIAGTQDRGLHPVITG